MSVPPSDETDGGGNSGVELRARQVYERAIGLPPSEREKFLRDECARDSALRGRVELMLDAAAAHTRPAAATVDLAADSPSGALPTLDPTTAGGGADAAMLRPGDRLSAGAEASALLGSSRPAPPPQPSFPAHPTQIGPYKLLEVIGEGGFGTVWIADQIGPVRRRVALKIIKPGMDSRAVIARFEQERQALAIMDHPNIAKVLDAGSAPDGRPYFVMEYVPGESITAYCDRNRLTVPKRLELFVSVCEAVQHAHHKGIIHRDIKPTNVLVSVTAGGGPIVKVIDFGVAKAVSHTLTDKTLFTEHGQILGTPEYMSPEQAEMGALDIDTRTDVYSLGVLLYELLTGALPFDPKTLRSVGYNEIQRIIREVDPPRPSNRLKSLGGAASADIAQRRHAKLNDLESQLRRELEWIPLKAMRKDRRERYATPTALADDIRNHLAGLPLVAGPESVWYRARKFVGRNRFAVAAVTAIAVALLAGAVVSTIGFVRAARSEQLARAEAVRANAEAGRANAEAARLRQVNQFTTQMLGNANPTKGEPRDVSVLALLDSAVLQLDAGSLADQPAAEASVRAALANTFRSLSQWRPAEIQFRKALEMETAIAGADSAQAARALAGLGHVQVDLGQLDKAEASLLRALQIQRDQLAADDTHIADTLNALGELADKKGDLESAQARYREALAIYERHPRNAILMADVMTNLATALYKLGDVAQADELTRGALEIRKRRFGGRSPEVWHSLTTFASLQEGLGDLASAEKSRREALALARELFDEKHRNTVVSMRSLAWTLWLRGDRAALDEAEPLLTRALELACAVDGAQSLTVAQVTQVLACVARDRGDVARAVEQFRTELALRRSVQSPDHPDVAGTMTLLADALTRAGQAPEAVELATRALEIRKPLFPAGHWVIGNTTSVLGGALAGAAQPERAEPLLLEGYQKLEGSTSALGRRAKFDAAARLAAFYEKAGKPTEAAAWKAKAAPAAPATAPATQP